MIFILEFLKFYNLSSTWGWWWRAILKKTWLGECNTKVIYRCEDVLCCVSTMKLLIEH